MNALTSAPVPSPADANIQVVQRYNARQQLITTIENYVDGVAAPNEIATDRMTEYHYDSAGNLVAQIDPLGRVSVTIYDLLHRPIEQIAHCTDGAGHPRLSDCAATHGAANDEKSGNDHDLQRAGRTNLKDRSTAPFMANHLRLAWSDKRNHRVYG